MSDDQIIGHPLDGCDEKECYDTMMSERTELIKARREAEDNLVKTIIQLSSALLVLLSGYVVEKNISFTGLDFWLFCVVVISTVICVGSGLGEHRFSSKAYQKQQELVEKFYTKKISTFDEPQENRIVRGLQKVQFFAFIIALLLIGLIAIRAVGTSNDTRQPAAASSSAASAASPAASAASPAASAAASAASAASAATSSKTNRGEPN